MQGGGEGTLKKKASYKTPLQLHRDVGPSTIGSPLRGPTLGTKPFWLQVQVVKSFSYGGGRRVEELAPSKLVHSTIELIGRAVATILYQRYIVLRG